jgi:periplasmic divalent cation tolerance protein
LCAIKKKRIYEEHAMSSYIFVLSTVPDKKKGREIARALVEARLAACVTVSADAQSYYWWEGKISEDRESMLFMKTKEALYEKLEARLKELHPYTVPEIIALPIVKGSEKYLRWLEEETE